MAVANAVNAAELTPMKILFLCVANSARSQMAEGIARRVFGENIALTSAGSHPKSINPLAIEVMQEIGIDISHQVAKSIDTLEFSSIDLIITLCAEEVCLVVTGNQQQQHWPLPDPANPQLDKVAQKNLFRQVRDELMTRIIELKKALNLQDNYNK